MFECLFPGIWQKHQVGGEFITHLSPAVKGLRTLKGSGLRIWGVGLVAALTPEAELDGRAWGTSTWLLGSEQA